MCLSFYEYWYFKRMMMSFLIFKQVMQTNLNRRNSKSNIKRYI